MTTKEVHKLVKHIVSKHSDLERTNTKTRRVLYIWRTPSTFREVYSENMRLLEFSISYTDKDVLQQALDELDVYLTLKGYPVKLKSEFRFWRNTAQIEIYANIR